MNLPKVSWFVNSGVEINTRSFWDPSPCCEPLFYTTPMNVLNFLTVIQRKFIQREEFSNGDQEHVHNLFRYVPISLYFLVKNECLCHRRSIAGYRTHNMCYMTQKQRTKESDTLLMISLKPLQPL